MTLWNLIRDFFVQNIFGGFLSNGDLISDNLIGGLYNSNSLDTISVHTSDAMYQISPIDYVDDYQQPLFISVGDWLSTTFTIITLILLVIFLYLFVKWIFRVFSGFLH